MVSMRATPPYHPGGWPRARTARGQASAAAVSVIDDARLADPASVVQEAHCGLKATRGAAVAVADIDRRPVTCRYSGVGNIAGSVVTEGGSAPMISMNGTLGHELRGVRQFEYPTGPPEALMVMHSDGLALTGRLR